MTGDKPIKRYQPKGGMCAGCVYRDDNCSHLPFDTMPVLALGNRIAIVRCTEYRSVRTLLTTLGMKR